MLPGFTLLLRRLHTSCVFHEAEKALLSKLRKKTGFSLINCKKALEQFSNDIEQAETWLREQAQKEGWAKATKLQGRPMSQGLVGIVAEGNQAAMIEVNCETDFVARNTKFHSLVSLAATTCLQHLKTIAETKIVLDTSGLGILKAAGNTTLRDQVALTIGSVGENIALRRAVLLKAHPATALGSYVHTAGPLSVQHEQCIMGQFGALVLFRQLTPGSSEESRLSAEELGRQLCQHIVGMNPESIGDMEDIRSKHRLEQDQLETKEIELKDQRSNPEDQNSIENDQATEAIDREYKETVICDTETKLVCQDFLLDSSLTVGELLLENCTEVIDYARFECGEEERGAQSRSDSSAQACKSVA